MSIQFRRAPSTRIEWAKRGIVTAVLMLSAMTAIAADKAEPDKRQISGEEIFRREWLPNDPRSHGGDGLGPVFNDSSCVACHNQGGIGGGGLREKNVQLMTVNIVELDEVKRRLSKHGARNAETTREAENFDKEFRRQLIMFHPDFRRAKTVVVHRFGVDEKHADWRHQLKGGSGARFAVISQIRQAPSFQFRQANHAKSIFIQHSFPMPSINALVPSRALQSALDNNRDTPRTQLLENGSDVVILKRARLSIAEEIQRLKSHASLDISSVKNFGLASILTSQRNTTALFGAGLIDSIPAKEIKAAANRKYKDFPGVTGRIHRLKNGRIGRFGWKAQEASLYDFTMAACGVELGLHVPDHPQSVVPYNPKHKAAGFDLNQREADALVDYMQNLPRPVQQSELHPVIAKQLKEGAQLFESVGCAACHVRQMGTVDGFFSDLLLHDMGPDLVSPGAGYSGPSFRAPGDDVIPLAQTIDEKTTNIPNPPTAQEWRTPPLWGVRDSAPYLHDGRATTLEEAIAFHGDRKSVV